MEVVWRGQLQAGRLLWSFQLHHGAPLVTSAQVAVLAARHRCGEGIQRGMTQPQNVAACTQSFPKGELHSNWGVLQGFT